MILKDKKITSLLKRLHVDSKRVRKIYEEYGDDYIVSTSTEEEKVELGLPNEFRSLLKEPKGLNPLFRKVKQYARNKEGLHERILLSTILVIVILVITAIVLLFHLMILITDSITSSHVLYTMRKSLSIRIRPVSKNVIMFENQINWDEPITLVEGVFDAISVKRNVIPILGKFIPKILNDTIYKKGVKSIKILLDKDAQRTRLFIM